MKPNGYHDLREEILEHVWMLEEDGEATLSALLARLPRDDVEGELERIAGKGMLRREGGTLALTEAGRSQARHVVRANRLAARFLADILELPPGLCELQACRLEHAISPALADRLCTFLGHPPTAPDGRAIPTGACCANPKAPAGPAIQPLPRLEVGSEGRVTFIHPRFTERLDQLAAMGLMPGATVRLRQRRPAVVLEIGESTLALDLNVADDIFVKPV